MDFEAFLALLPAAVGDRPLRHVLDVRHESFATPHYLALARRHGYVTVHTDSPKFPAIADADAPFAYLRLMRSEAHRASGYPREALDAWAAGAQAWARGDAPLPGPRDVFVFFINGAKERAPAAALELIRRFSG
ncbi:hypothetical protein Rta_37960 [Ramlibacter tataouinensis TTB310]|uniref:DUF72 domain-containing protein n=1 Tax=Ramlibacter tataouinensis (strain ATCC BAA-407 / DSM 14655 / LMG 21543 / TTB310) TaxID=365046 RepID=F5Y332_RAMTT|nr:hypothetical protein Rta_37960 [Ramlibacter tataouinensis TTB310]